MFHPKPKFAVRCVLLLLATACGDVSAPSSLDKNPLLRQQNTLLPAATAPILSAGPEHVCAMRTDGVIHCWGELSLTESAATGSFAQLSSGGGFVCGLRTDGVAQCFGDNSASQAPVTRPAGTGTFTQINAGRAHTCALRTDGSAECWGSNASGQAPPTKTAPVGTFIQLAVGSTASHTCALQNNGDAVCWGNNDDGQAPASRRALVGRYKQITTGAEHTCALRRDNAVECWGSNANSQAPATRHATTSYFTQIRAGASHTCGLRGDFVVECWGSDDGPGESPASITAAAGRFRSLSGGNTHHCGLTSRGIVQCWGAFASGVQPAVPDAPASINATRGAPDITLGWTDAGAYWTIVQRSEYVFGKFTAYATLGEADTNGYTDAAAVPGKRYRYRLRSCNFSGCSAATNHAVNSPALTINSSADFLAPAYHDHIIGLVKLYNSQIVALATHHYTYASQTVTSPGGALNFTPSLVTSDYVDLLGDWPEAVAVSDPLDIRRLIVLSVVGFVPSLTTFGFTPFFERSLMHVPGATDYVGGVATSPGGEVFVWLPGIGVRKYTSSNGTLVLTLGASGSGTGALGTPGRGIATGLDGNLYVLDSSNNRIVRFNASTGAYLSNWPVTGTTTHTAMVISPTGRLYISNNNGGATIYDAVKGTVLGTLSPVGGTPDTNGWSGAGGTPTGIESMLFDDRGYIYLYDPATSMHVFHDPASIL